MQQAEAVGAVLAVIFGVLGAEGYEASDGDSELEAVTELDVEIYAYAIDDD